MPDKSLLMERMETDVKDAIKLLLPLYKFESLKDRKIFEPEIEILTDINTSVPDLNPNVNAFKAKVNLMTFYIGDINDYSVGALVGEMLYRKKNPEVFNLQESYNCTFRKLLGSSTIADEVKKIKFRKLWLDHKTLETVIEHFSGLYYAFKGQQPEPMFKKRSNSSFSYNEETELGNKYVRSLMLVGKQPIRMAEDLYKNQKVSEFSDIVAMNCIEALSKLRTLTMETLVLGSNSQLENRA